MEAYELVLKVFLILAEVVGGIGLIYLFSYLGTIIYDEIKSKTNDLYELFLTVTVGIEFLFRGRPKRKHEYRGRHRIEEAFIDDLYEEMLTRPGSLCYDKKLSIAIRKTTPTLA